MEEKEIIKYLITSAGDVLTSREEILDYLNQVRIFLKEIRGTSKFADDFKQGNLAKYFELEESLKLLTSDNIKLNTEDTYEWMEKNKIK